MIIKQSEEQTGSAKSDDENRRSHHFALFVRPEQGILSAMGIHRQ